MKKELFDHEIKLLKNTFRRLLRRHARTNLIKLLEKTHPADLALVFRQFNEDEQDILFGLMRPAEHTGDFLSELDQSITSRILSNEEPQRIADLLREISQNDQADLLGFLEEEQSEAILNLLQVDEKEELEEIMAYPEDSAGSLMATDVFILHMDITAREAISTIQEQEAAEMVFYLYVADDNNSLAGVVSLRDLVTTPGSTQLKDIMSRNVHTVRPDTDQEEVARIVSQYNYLAVPVVDTDGVLLGIVMVDDVVDVIREEATEDFLQMAGAGKDREILLKSSWENARTRLPWLLASWIGGILAVAIIGVFEDVIQSTIALAAFIPVIIGMGGNIGTQSSTIIVRGLATGRVDIENMAKLLFKEIRVGLILGILYGLMLGLFAIARFMDASPLLGVVVGSSICVSMLIATTIGACVPLLLHKLDIDPAVATGPFVTTSIDILGVSLYFLIASFFLVL